MKRALLCLAVALAQAAAADAQEPELDRIVDLFTTYWGQRELHSVLSLAAPSGISIEIDGGATGPLSPRQALATLRRFLDERETIALHTGVVRTTGGSPPRGYGEINWQTRSRGTTIPESLTIFLAFAREDNVWRITQIRVLPGPPAFRPRSSSRTESTGVQAAPEI